jgi:hypothetical protein
MSVFNFFHKYIQLVAVVFGVWCQPGAWAYIIFLLYLEPFQLEIKKRKYLMFC